MTCSDGTVIDYDQQFSEEENECGALFETYQSETDYNTERGDGSLG